MTVLPSAPWQGTAGLNLLQVLKLKTAEFKILTRSHTPVSPHSSCEELTAIALSLRERVALGPRQRFRVGVGLSSFLDPQDISAQPLFVRLGSRLYLDTLCIGDML